MILTTPPPAGAPIWIDLFSTDQAGAIEFYRSIFGWQVDATRSDEMGGYVNFTLNGHRVAGCMGGDGSMPSAWSVYLHTPDITTTAAAAEAAGCPVFVPPHPVAELGTFCVIADPTGAAIGMWQPGTHLGTGVVAEPGSPAWFELQTLGYDQALPFYRDVFGWDIHTMADTPGFRYSTLFEGDDQAAGVMDATAFDPPIPASAWGIYFNVADIEATAAHIVDLGGRVIDPPQDTPFGRMGTFADATGASFKLQQDTD